MTGSEQDRFRSFAERYVVERTRHTPEDKDPKEAAFLAVLDARAIYLRIYMESTRVKEAMQAYKSDDNDANIGVQVQGAPPAAQPTQGQQRPKQDRPWGNRYLP